ncbi:nucleotide-binding domain-containing protein [Lophiostoma macrostomum CBS 122681]|uniref:Nucleotide-binding domain-containing protein n=1 Tax=Lophiostoma macrostomum CBS 122681 TaxID=1314788 RepID=A0A6A6SRV1_9PLEO|nr:nucleotide-binding domain-containing protein [Lophiostoma macrostomum CBS 122681]
MANEKSTVILGGGIIGLSIAYYTSLSSPITHITIVDSASILLESASGYAGGFLARDWFDPRVAALGDYSFTLHRELAEQFDGAKRWGFTGSHVYSLTLDDAPGGVSGEDWLLAGTSRANAVGRMVTQHVNAPGEGVNADGTPAWISKQDKASWKPIAGVEDCGQVEPRRLCEFLLEKCKERGIKILLGKRAVDIVRKRGGGIEGLMIENAGKSEGSKEEQFLKCTDIVIAAGCWTPRVFNTLFPSARISLDIDSLAGHSILYRTPRYAQPFKNIAKGQLDKAHGKDEHISYAIYCPPTKQWDWSGEAYARLNADSKPEIWSGGLNHTSTQLPLPELATDSKKLIKPECMKSLRKAAVTLTGLRVSDSSEPATDDIEIVSEHLCFRPASKSGVPILGEVAARDLGKGFGEGGGAKVWVAGGHGPWGISMSLGTGKVMRDLMAGTKPEVDVSALKVVEGAPLSKL